MNENMENLGSPFFADKLEKTNQRRRSSFYQRRLSTFTLDISADLNVTSHGKNSQGEEGKLINYINELKKEKEDWKKLLGKLKKENSVLIEKSSLVDHVPSWELLTAEDKIFLQERPDYLGIVRLLDSTAKVVALKHRHINATTDKLYNFIQDCNQTIARTTNAIIDENIYNLDEFIHFDEISQEEDIFPT